MTKNKALQTFFSSFGIKAYPSNAVPSEVKFPWITYEPTLGDSWQETTIAVNLWYHTDSEKTPNDKADEIYKAIGSGGILLTCDDGILFVKRGNPWCQSLVTDGDASIKRRYMNVIIEYFTF